MSRDRETDSDDTYDSYDDGDAADSAFPYGGWFPAGWGYGWGWPPMYREEVADESGGARNTEDDSWWDEGIISLFLVGGVILFLFPEPATSTLGIFLILIGVGAWLADALM